MVKFKLSKKQERVFDILKQILGVAALVIGLLGLLLPILPGWILIFVGLELLGIQIVFIERIKDYVKRKIEETRKKEGKK